jgi:competence protein ComEA
MMRWMLVALAALSLAWGQEKTEKKMKKKAAEAVEEKKAEAGEKKASGKKKAAEVVEEKKAAAPVAPAAPAAVEKKVAEKKADAGEKKAAVKKGAPYAGGMVNINTATKTQLMALPGVGEANADYIIKGRPYKAADELISRKIVQPRYYDDFKQFVTTK